MFPIRFGYSEALFVSSKMWPQTGHCLFLMQGELEQMVFFDAPFS